jgi:hypothetical protein
MLDLEWWTRLLHLHEAEPQSAEDVPAIGGTAENIFS